MDIEHIRAFIAVVETGTFRGAAKQLRKAQPAVSYLIKGLETYLNATLFDRTAYRPVLTEKGTSFLSKAYRFMESFDEINAFKSSVGQKVETDVALSVSGLYPLKKLSDILAKVKDEYPHTSVSIQVDLFGGIERLTQSKADIAVIEQMVDNPNLEGEECLLVPMILVFSSRHPLNGRTMSSLDELSNFPQVIVKSSSLKPVKDRGVSKTAIRWVVSDFGSKKDLLLHSFGWGYLPNHMVEADLQRNHLSSVRTKRKQDVTVPLYKVKPKHHRFGPVLSMIWELL